MNRVITCSTLTRGSAGCGGSRRAGTRPGGAGGHSEIGNAHTSCTTRAEAASTIRARPSRKGTTGWYPKASRATVVSAAV